METLEKRGFAAILSTILILIAGLIIVTSISYISLNSIKIIRNNIYSIKAFYLAEGGIEDMLLRIKTGMSFSSPESLTTDEGIATIEVMDPIGGTRTIVSSGDSNNRIRKVRVVYVINTENVSFHYGAQAGEGGIEMSNNSRIKGNVFSNGSVVGLGGRGYIDYTVKVATTGNKIEGLIIGEDAYAHNCKNCTIGGTFYYSGGGQENCTASAGVKNHPVQESEDLPLSDEQINKWKEDALKGGAFINNYTVLGGTIDYLGPRKIEGNLTLENNATLVITGTVWVVGNITIKNGGVIRLDNGYGSMSGIVVSDGKISVENGANIQGSGQSGSYTLMLSTNSSLDYDSPAINVKNNAQGAVFYASAGLINLQNNMQIREATGYKLYLNNNAVIEYESGLSDMDFSSGPGASWQIVEWKEVE